MSVADLPARILAEIERVEGAARAATAGPWDHDPNSIAEWSVYGAGGWMVASATAYDDDIAQMSNGAANLKHPPQRIDSVANAAHIALNDPHTVLRRCAADRRILERHKLGAAEAWDTELDADRRIEYCTTCTVGNGCYCCITDDRAYELWPCATLRDLADGYDITVEG